MQRFLYSAWEDGDDADRLSAGGVLDALTQDLLKHGDMELAMQELLRRGYTSPDGAWSMPGMGDFMQQLEATREAWLQRYAADSFRLAGEQIEQYQQQIDAAADAMAAQFEQFRGQSHATALAPTAEARYREQEVALQRRYEALQRELATRRGAPPPERQSEMTQRLDDLLPQLHPDAEDGDAFEQAQQAMRLRLRSQIMRRRHAALTAAERYLDRALRVEQRLNAFPFCGSEPLGVAEAERLLHELHYLDDLLRRMRWHPGRMIDINPERLQHLLDETDAPSQQLEKLEALLQRDGLARRTAHGLRLTSQGVRHLGASILDALFPPSSKLLARRYATRQTGALSHETKPYDFGDAFCLDLAQTLAEATRRQSGASPPSAARGFRRLPARNAHAARHRSRPRHEPEHGGAATTPLRRGQKSRPGAGALDSGSLSPRHPVYCGLRGQRARAAHRRPAVCHRRARAHQHPGRLATGAAVAQPATRRRQANRHDHGRAAHRGAA